MKQTLLSLIYLNLSFLGGAQTFNDITVGAGINHVYDYGDFHFGGGAAVIDYDNDGYEDLYLVGGTNPDALYKNNGDGTFTDVFAGTGISETDTVITIGAIAGDINNDGYADLFITTRSSVSDYDRWTYNLLYLNNGDGTFSNISSSAGIYNKTSFSTSAAMADYNKDGYLDIYVLNFLGVPIYSLLDSSTASGIPGTPRPGSDNFLFTNNGDMTFTENAISMGVVDSGCGWATIFSDFNGDSNLDLYTANDFGPKCRPNGLYINNYPTSSFTDFSAGSNTNAAINAMGVDAGDINEDGMLDYYVTDLDTNILYVNMGAGIFSDETISKNVINSGWQLPGGHRASVGWGANFFDYDHDSYIDLFVCNGALNPMMTQTNQVDTFYNPNIMYHNGPSFTFTEMGSSLGLDDPQRGRGSVIFDYDNDGDMDLFVVNQRHYQGYGINENPTSKLYQNNAASGNWLKVALQGSAANSQGIGSLISLYSNGRKLIREVHAGSSHLSSSSPIAHFGIDTIAMIDSVSVNWLNGNQTTVYDISPNQKITINEAPDDIQSQKLSSFLIYPNPFQDSFIINTDGLIGYTYTVFDMSGRVVLSGQINRSQTQINCSSIDIGSYNIVFRKKNMQSFNSKLVKH
jgi:hypothetical protein